MAAAIAAAILFGVSAPAAKVLASHAEPLVLGAILYLGAGLGLSVVRLARRTRSREAPLRRSDLPILLGVTAAGGVLAPVLLLVGLQRVSAVTGSLLLNLEGPITVVLAVLFFGEHLGSYAAVGTLCIMAGAATLSLAPGGSLRGQMGGVLAIAAACLAWALDNNLTQRLSLRDPVAIVQAKGLIGGGIAITLAFMIGNHAPPVAMLVWGLLLGFVSYGLSVVLAVYAIRVIGVAREAALFATAPFIGVVTSVAILRERFGLRELGTMFLMLTGISLLLRDQHAHLHAHDPVAHDHLHVHDEHHQHTHLPEDPPGEPHAHLHQHDPVEHSHPHAADLHHRHH
jgi:drug/metabolite transporter (DMT)-like permease